MFSFAELWKPDKAAELSHATWHVGPPEFGEKWATELLQQKESILALDFVVVVIKIKKIIRSHQLNRKYHHYNLKCYFPISRNNLVNTIKEITKFKSS